MAGEIRKYRRSEGTTVSAPTDLSILNEADSFVSYANDAAYVTAKGSAAVDSDVYYNTTDHTQRMYQNGAWAVVGVGAADADAAGSVTSFTPTVKSSIHTVTDANYTILDDDGYRTILVDPGASARGITLPTAADNEGRIITVKKITADAGFVTLLGEAAGETIDGISGTTGIDLPSINDSITVECDGSDWYITEFGIVVAFQARTDTSAQSLSGGAANTVQFQSTVYDTHGAFSANTTFTAPVDGYYAFGCYTQITGQSVNAAQFMNLELYKGGVSTAGGWLDRWEAHSTATLVPKITGTTQIWMDAGNTATINILESVTGTPTIVNVNGRCHFEGRLVSR